MSSMERLIIQNIARDRLKESLGVEEVEAPNVNIEEVLDLLCSLSTMSAKGYDKQPEGTTQKKAYRNVEAKLLEIGAGVKRERAKNAKGIVGDFEDIDDVGKIKK